MINKSEYNHLSILGIALECGFNSKSAFNRLFKKYTGLTPTEYKTSNELAPSNH
jgi:AraC-like DNA-binding protein